MPNRPVARRSTETTVAATWNARRETLTARDSPAPCGTSMIVHCRVATRVLADPMDGLKAGPPRPKVPAQKALKT